MKNFNMKLAAIAAAGLMASPLSAQTDVSDLLLNNYGFDDQFDYDRNATGNVAQEILEVPGWTKAHEMDYTIIGTYEFGTKKTFNSTGKVPEQGHDGSRGCLALSTGWESSLTYIQAVVLPAGDYTLRAAWYNGSGQTAGYSLMAWMPDGGTPVKSSVSSFPNNQWTVDDQTFTLTKETSGNIQLGFKAAPQGSANSAKVVLDYVKLMLPDAQAVALIKTYLQKEIAEAETLYGDGSGIGAQTFRSVIDSAKSTVNNGSSTYTQLHSVYLRLKDAYENYANDNASETNPRDISDRWIPNGSFESGTDGWEVNGMSTQTNAYFTLKNGNTYVEKWVNRGEKLGSAALLRTLSNLPAGKYRLTAAALHIQQTGSNSTTNVGNPQTGAFLTAGDYSTPITEMERYTVDFVVVNEGVETVVGMTADQATGNWVTIDDFKLYYTGALDVNALSSYLGKQVDKAKEYIERGIGNDVKAEVETAISKAESAMSANPMSETALREAITQIEAANAKAAESRYIYAGLEEEIEYARKVYGWWKDLASKADNCALLQAAITTAEGQAADYSLSVEALAQAVTTLEAAVKKVDKGIYESGNAVGTGTALHDTNSEWCYQRSIQSKHWILYWDRGYGNTIPSGISEILEAADGEFEFYANTLGFITINEGSSKTDKYKMIIRLRSTTDWEASGSGIDDTIGLLTLSRNAYTSRSGQTLGHEIGHCFQYQVHCDNNNWNGWMYTWADSPNGNVFWEMCAQWQAYKYYPHMQFNNNEWLTNTLKGFNQNPFEEELRYNNFFIQDYICHKQNDIKAVARLWNETKNPEDPFQTYMRICMDGTTEEKLAQLGDEMWEYGARLTTFDFDHLNEAGKNTIGLRPQTSMRAQNDDYFRVLAADCPENYGNNAIKLVVPEKETIVCADFVGLADTTGYRGYRTEYAGWRVGFVAYKADGTRYYSNPTRIAGGDAPRRIVFTCPEGVKYLWCVVSGAPTKYWTRGWDGNVNNNEQWPYRIRFRNTNLYGKAVVTEDLSGVDEVPVAESRRADVYTITGVKVRSAEEGTEGLPAGLYIIGGRKVLVK